MNTEKASFKAQGLERVSRNPRITDRRTVGGTPLIRSTRKIQEMRKALGLTQAQLASALGIRTSMIANLENGRYAAFILVGIRMYLVFASVASQKNLTTLYLEAKREAARFIAFQRSNSAEFLRQADREAKKKRRQVEAIEKQLAEEETRLKALP